MANYNEIYDEAYGSLEDQYTEKKKNLNDAWDKEQTSLDEQKKAADERNLETRNEALRQAFISRKQNERSMPGLMTAQGLSGGPSETAIASVMRGYQNTRNAANKEYGTNQTTLDTDYSSSNTTLGSKYAQLLNDLQTQRTNDAVTQAQLQYQAALQQEQIEWEKEQIRQQQAAQAAAAASGGSSSSSRGSGGGISTTDTPDYIETGGAQSQAYTGGVKPTTTMRNKVKINGVWQYM